ncbi:DEAD/DEAH box helicase family protein [Nannocystis radixulma]|uniref:DEAD/DEAH box helicase family protein n=1 Tax=Nannocystis radixulma TaxID=2995305 RepID=A0ABT5BCC1_9BACT|nr:DEAD/DEAH box helicase family protein [Nannocystis radixulma]MDC0671794.1 DEAD/DEAH box helicase family protein [Nannocystis radixulma]
MSEGTGAIELAANASATAWRCGAVIEVRPRRALRAIEDASPAELSDIFALVGAVQREHVPAGARIEFVSGSGEPLVVRVHASAGPPELLALRGFVPGQEAHFVDVIRAGLRLAAQVDIVAAFVMVSGLREIVDELDDALERGARVRVLTGDTLGITEPEALGLLLARASDRLEVRMHCCPRGQTFHAKAYVFVAADERGVAYVGSSNLSRSALREGIEWNLRAVAEQAEFAAIRARFEALWRDPCAQVLTPTLLADYRARRPVAPPVIEAFDRPPPRPTPHPIQVEALARLEMSRRSGHRRGLVVLATGLGKTLLSAFDFAATGWSRALFVAHREEILKQACAAWERVLPERALGRWFGGERDDGAEVVFASIQSLTRAGALAEIAAERFDYLVIDEFHHAAADTYQRLLRHLRPKYLLGLTATPERGDGAELLALCDDNLVYRAGLSAGLAAGLLAPFHYHAIRDDVDYEQIPWRSGRFDEAALTQAVATREHAGAALRALDEHAPRARRRALVFCCSVAHADFMATFLREQGVAAAAVHSGPTSAPRAESLRRFAVGELAALTAVDLFNEGLDVPDIDAVLMLRPTESPVVFLQQIGRGLRLGCDRPKSHLTVVDIVGNHRSFLDKLDALRALLDSGLGRVEVLRALRGGTLALPPGCAVELPTVVIDLLEQLCVREREADSRAAVLELVPPIQLKLNHNQTDPILMLNRERRPDTPQGEVEVEVDGEPYVFRFVKIAVNVATGPGSKDNVLPDILHRWFGARAGWGKEFVTLARRHGRWRLEPVREEVAPIRRGVPFYRELAVAAGLGPLSHAEPRAEVAAIRAAIAVDAKRHFVVQIEGDSMDGGEAPIRDGDLVLCEWVRERSLREVEGQPCVLAIVDGPELAEVVLKIPVQDGQGWLLRSRNPKVPDRRIAAGVEVRVVARALGPVALA